MEPDLVPGRSCGTCNVCCVALTIDDGDLQKPQGYRCRNLQPDHKCAIYETRPKTCSAFYCGFRKLTWVADTLRPDTSGVLIRLQSKITATGEEEIGVVFMLLDRASLKAEGLAESIAAAVAADIPVYLNVPGPPGYTSAIARINDVLADAVWTKDKPAVLKMLRQIRAGAKSGDYQPIIFKNPPTP